MRRALLLGRKPEMDLGMDYVREGPFEAVVMGSLTLGQLICFREEAVLEALGAGIPVYLYTPGLPESPKNRGLSASLAQARRQLKAWGVIFTDGGQKLLITAEKARVMVALHHLKIDSSS